METRISNHARQRIKERCGTNKKKSAERLCRLAVERGLEADATTGSIRRWADQKSREGTKIYLYGDKAYIFSDPDMVLITVIPIPQDILRIHLNNRKKAIRQAAFAM